MFLSGTSLRCLIFFAGISQTSALAPKAAAPDTPWDDLEAVLSSPDILTVPEVSDWRAQCIDPFIKNPFVEEYEVSNHRLFNQSSGVCMDYASCIFPTCYLPGIGSAYPNDYMEFLVPTQDDAILEAFDLLLTKDLPARVLHPKTTSDVVHAIRFCERFDVGVTVKVAGHSAIGASTAGGTLLIKMSTNYPIYSLAGSITECDSSDMMSEETNSANAMACAVAMARNKTAVMRVGGGELFDHSYRAVSFEWNSENPDRMYHLIGGASGSVSAAGGWLASGGLAGYVL